MVFSSSVPVYLDPPNWPQQQVNGNEIPQQLPFLHPPNPNVTTAANGSVGRLGASMAERARLAKVVQPEGPLKCPRCDSMNTKFCYFNNYSLSQPRYFCKTCRRYWTRGGALRNVPVGGGCRRNKKNKNSSNKSKSPAVPDRQIAGLEFPTAAVQPTEALQTDSHMYGFNFGRIVHTSTMEDINNSGSSQQKLMALQGGLDQVSREMTILSSFGSDRVEQPCPNFFPGFVMPQVGNYNLGQMKMEEMLNGGLDFTRPVINNSGYNQGSGSSYNLI